MGLVRKHGPDMNGNTFISTATAVDLLPVLADVGAAERERWRQLVADNSWACTFQTMGQYRRALLAALGA